MSKTVMATVRSVPKHAKNPFVASLIAEVEIGHKHVQVGARQLADTDTGEADHLAAYKQRITVDKDQFIKLFLKHQEVFFDLSTAAQKTLRPIFDLTSKRPNQDTVLINWPTAEVYYKENDLKCSRSTWFRGVTELIDKKFIAETLIPSQFFINPSMFFNGDRVLFIREIVKQDPTHIDDATQLIGQKALENGKELTNNELEDIALEFKNALDKKKK